MANEATSTFRTCKHCKTEKPLTEFTKGAKGLYRYKCRKCSAEYQRNRIAQRKAAMTAEELEALRLRTSERNKRYKERHPDRVKESVRKSKAKAFARDPEEYRRKDRERAARRMAELLASDCPEDKAKLARKRKKHREADRRYWRGNPEAKLATSRKYRRNNLEKVRAAARAYYARETERYSQYHKKYRATEKGKAQRCGCEQRRRARKKGALCTVTPAEVANLLESATCCIYCEANFSNELRPTLEHKIPLSRGGDHTLDNLAVACGSCNSRKGSKTPAEFGFPEI